MICPTCQRPFDHRASSHQGPECDGCCEEKMVSSGDESSGRTAVRNRGQMGEEREVLEAGTPMLKKPRVGSTPMAPTNLEEAMTERERFEAVMRVHFKLPKATFDWAEDAPWMTDDGNTNGDILDCDDFWIGWQARASVAVVDYEAAATVLSSDWEPNETVEQRAVRVVDAAIVGAVRVEDVRLLASYHKWATSGNYRMEDEPCRADEADAIASRILKALGEK